MTVDKAEAALFEELFDAIDAMDMERFLSCIDESATFRFGSAPAVKGHAAIRAGVEGFFASIAGLKHALKRRVAEDHAIVYEGEVTYTRHDGSVITLPFANVFEVDIGLICLYRIYIDIAPLYAE